MNSIEKNNEELERFVKDIISKIPDGYMKNELGLRIIQLFLNASEISDDIKYIINKSINDGIEILNK